MSSRYFGAKANYEEALAEGKRALEAAEHTLAEAREDKERLANVARGCHDYGGGYRDTRESEIYHHGIQTVINALEAAATNPNDSQAAVLERIGIDSARKEEDKQ